MLIIGSTAISEYFKPGRPINHKSDLDLMMMDDEYWNSLESWKNDYPNLQVNKCTDDYSHLSNAFGFDNVEIYFGHSDNSTEQLIRYVDDAILGKEIAPLNVLYAIKMSHRYLRNSPHFIKTHRDIMLMRKMGANMDDPVLYEIFKLREKETYNYKHPVLDQSKSSFFSGDGVDYIYDHDTIHEAVKITDKPAYMNYIVDGADVMTSKEKFFNCSKEIQLLGVYEETCVLALERSQIPNNFELDPRSSFVTALIKVCTSITSGWFREFAYESFDEIITMYRQCGEHDYINRFNANIEVLKPYEV
jgi:hypothetical protein